MRRMQIIFVLMVISCLLSCSSSVTVYAPVSDANIEQIPGRGTYTVQAGDTLYSIAFRYGLDYKYLVKINNIDSSYHITVGQKIYLKNHPQLPPALSVPKVRIEQTPVEREPVSNVTAWAWPAKGPIVGTFSGLNKGINIAGHLGAPVFATAPGKVVYSGNGLRGYGNLIIIKHNSSFLSAYAHNNKILVQQGQWVQKGQKIASMGNSGGASKVMVHFEIRQNGRPVNPLAYLR